MKIFSAANNYGSTVMSDSDIDEECRKANRIFEGTPRCESGSKKKVVNVLFVCSTNYTEYYKYNKKTIHKKQYFCSRDNLDEVIVLDLSSEESRAEFFGVTLLSEESKAVEMILAKSLENIK